MARRPQHGLLASTPLPNSSKLSMAPPQFPFLTYFTVAVILVHHILVTNTAAKITTHVHVNTYTNTNTNTNTNNYSTMAGAQPTTRERFLTEHNDLSTLVTKAQADPSVVDTIVNAKIDGQGAGFDDDSNTCRLLYNAGTGLPELLRKLGVKFAFSY